MRHGYYIAALRQRFGDPELSLASYLLHRRLRGTYGAGGRYGGVAIHVQDTGTHYLFCTQRAEEPGVTVRAIRP